MLDKCCLREQKLKICFLLPSSLGHHIAAGQSHRAAAGLADRPSVPAWPSQRKCAPGAGETADSGPAERGTSQFSQAAVSTSAGAAAVGKGEREAPAAGWGHWSQAPTKGGRVQTTGGRVAWGLWNRFQWCHMCTTGCNLINLPQCPWFELKFVFCMTY